MADEGRRDRSTPTEDLYSEYTVYDTHYEKIGKIDDLFVDENDNPEYVGVKMGFLGTRSTLIPVDIVRVNDRRRLVEVAADKETVKNGPTFSDDREITPEFERQVFDYYRVESRQASANREGYGAYYPETTGEERVDLRPGEHVGEARAGSKRAGAATNSLGRERPASPRREAAADTANEGTVEHSSERTTIDEDEIRVQRSEEELVAGTREREAGSVNVRKRVRTERERLSVPKMREEVSVERVPVEEGWRETEDGEKASERGIVEEDGEIRVPIVEEEIVVEKRPMVKEEIRLRKNVVEDEEVVEEDLRKEEVDVEDRTKRGEGSRRSSATDRETTDLPPKETRNEAGLEDVEEERREKAPGEDRRRTADTDSTAEEDRKSLPIADYDNLTVEETKERLGGLSKDEMRRVRSHEKKHKNRNTLIRWLDRRINATS